MSAPLLLATAAVTVSLAAGICVAGTQMFVQVSLQGAVDSAALAAADATHGYVNQIPCEAAALVLSAFSAELLSCVVVPESGNVRIKASAVGPLSRVFAQSHAGTPPHPQQV